MFEVSIITCIVCLASYALLRYAIIPLVLSLFTFRGRPAIEHFRTKITPHEQQHHAQIVICFFHAIISCQGAIRALWQLPQTTETYASQMVAPDTQTYLQQLMDDPLRSFYLELTLGYFVADTIIYLIYINKYPFLDVLHHLICISSYTVGLTTGVANWGMLCLQTNEISTPMLHVRYFMTQWDLKDHWFYQANQAIFAVLFFFCRVVFDCWVFGVAFWAWMTRECTAPYWAQVYQMFCCGLFVFVQLLWFYKIVGIAVAKLRGSSKKQKQKEKSLSASDDERENKKLK